MRPRNELDSWERLAEILQNLTYEEFHKDFQDYFIRRYGG